VSATKEPTNGNSASFEVVAAKNSSGSESFESRLDPVEVTVQQEVGPHVSMGTGSKTTVSGQENALYSGRWASATSGNWGFEADATDPGLGVSSDTWSSSVAPKWGATQHVECKGVQCPTPFPATYGVKGKEEQLPEGEDTIEVHVKDPVGFEAGTGVVKVKIDDAPPHGITLSGLLSDHEISDGQHFTLTAGAVDGSGSTPSSGVASIVLEMDGQPLGAPSKTLSQNEGWSRRKQS
jgi:hypothetical protein